MRDLKPEDPNEELKEKRALETFLEDERLGPILEKWFNQEISGRELVTKLDDLRDSARDWIEEQSQDLMKFQDLWTGES